MTRIAFLDVDGTILEHGSVIAPSTVTAIRRARENGHRVWLCTGRSAGDLGYRVVIVEDACAAADQATHDATIASFGLLGEVASADDVIAALA